MKKDTAQKVQLRRSKSQKRLAIMTSKKNVDLKKYTFEDAENTVQKQPKRIMAQFLNSEPEIFQETLLAIIDLGNKTANELAKDMYDAYYSKKI
jgi:hypothetical protein